MIGNPNEDLPSTLPVPGVDVASREVTKYTNAMNQEERDIRRPRSRIMSCDRDSVNCMDSQVLFTSRQIFED
jgi:hypothetical protein